MLEEYNLVREEREEDKQRQRVSKYLYLYLFNQAIIQHSKMTGLYSHKYLNLFRR